MNYTPLQTAQAQQELQRRHEARRIAARAELERRGLVVEKQFPSFSAWLPEVSPELCWSWLHLQFIQAEVEAFLVDPFFDILILTVPPRHGKSECVTVRLPAWLLERKESDRVIVAAYSQTLADKFSRKTRRIARARIRLSTERTAVDDWETEGGGGYRAVGVGGGITGMGANVIIIDDPVKNRAEAESLTFRNKVYDWYTDDLSTRLEPKGKKILIQTRWHLDDLAGRILKSEEGARAKLVNLPAFAETDDPLGRAEGQALCPERYDEAALNKLKTLLKTSFTALFQQRPVNREGGIFKLDWWNYFNPAALPNFKRVVQSWDTAFKAKEVNDFSVGITFGETKTDTYIPELWRGKLEYPDLRRTIISQAEKWKPVAILIEDKASGQSLIQDLKKNTSLPVVAVPVHGDKVERASVISSIPESGRVWLPEQAPWLTDFLDETSSFPSAPNDDIVDGLSQGLTWLHGGSVDTLDKMITRAVVKSRGEITRGF